MFYHPNISGFILNRPKEKAPVHKQEDQAGTEVDLQVTAEGGNACMDALLTAKGLESDGTSHQYTLVCLGGLMKR